MNIQFLTTKLSHAGPATLGDRRGANRRWLQRLFGILPRSKNLDLDRSLNSRDVQWTNELKILVLGIDENRSFVR